MEVEIKEVLEILERTPATLRSLLSALSEPWISGAECPDTWNARDIVGHLIHGEITDWIPRTKIILEHGDSRAFEPFDRFAMKNRPQRTMAELLDEFESLRKQSIA